MKDELNLKILIAGEGGQGVQAIGQILNEAAIQGGFESIYIPNYGVEQRGGVSLAYVQIARQPLYYPKFKIADCLVVLCNRAIPRVRSYCNYQTKIINLIGLEEKLNEHHLSYRTYNMFVLGVISEFIPLSEEEIMKVLIKKFQAKGISQSLLTQNKQAFLLGRAFTLRLPRFVSQLAPRHTFKEKKEKIVFSDKKKTWKINPRLCKSCGICLFRCPSKALSFNSQVKGVYGMPTATCDIQKCLACGLCERVCPEGAIELKKKKL
jgi:Pyruvate/2-oxoacid:ferredoxin oxidoreductase gamma subunit/NAD-dependent dihydropyrimidine dehydrogenase PreA subunit